MEEKTRAKCRKQKERSLTHKHLFLDTQTAQTLDKVGKTNSETNTGIKDKTNACLDKVKCRLLKTRWTKKRLSFQSIYRKRANDWVLVQTHKHSMYKWHRSDELYFDDVNIWQYPFLLLKSITRFILKHNILAVSSPSVRSMFTNTLTCLLYGFIVFFPYFGKKFR